VNLSPDQQTGWKARLTEAWNRYKPLPLAVTEAHIGWCGPEEQVLWLCQAWDAVMALRDQGVDLQAITIWALCGAVDWNSLLTRREGHYEAGAFDARHPSGRLQPTLIAEAAAALSRHGRFNHPALPERGWWERDDRFHAPILADAAQ
jgi:dTDP-4-dehydrorhamnose reductase